MLAHNQIVLNRLVLHFMEVTVGLKLVLVLPIYETLLEYLYFLFIATDPGSGTIKIEYY